MNDTFFDISVELTIKLSWPGNLFMEILGATDSVFSMVA